MEQREFLAYPSLSSDRSAVMSNSIKAISGEGLMGKFLRIVAAVSCVGLMAACSGSPSRITPDTNNSSLPALGEASSPGDVAANDSAVSDSIGSDSIGSDYSEYAASGSTEVPANIQVSTRMLRAPTTSELGVELVDGSGFNKIVVRRGASSQAMSDTESRPFKFEVSRLENPPRLVVDVLGYSNQNPQSFVTADSDLVERVRIGAHPEKSRFVLDLVEGQEIEHRVEGIRQGAEVMGRSSGEELVVTIARPNTMQVALAADALQTGGTNDFTSPSEPDVRASFGEDVETAEVVVAKETIETSPAALPEVAVAEVGTVEVAEVENIERPRIVALSLEPVAPGENMIVAQISGNPMFDLKRTAPSEYVLSVDGAEVDASAMNTLVAVPGAGQIRTVRPVVAGNDVLLRIFAEPTAVLTSRAANGRIVILTRSDSPDARAQMDPTAAEAGASTSEEVKVSAESSGPSELDVGVAALLGDQPMYTGRLISLDLQDTDIDNALRIIAEVSNLNIIASDDVTGKVTLRLIDVPWDQALDVILKTNGLDKVQEGNVVRIAPVEKLRLEREALKQAQQAEEELEPLQVRYIRVSYAKASDLRPLIESVVSERGSVAYDERTNQLIIKDIRKGVKNVVELVSKLDLRTPQILLETQIVEANRNLLRALGTNLGFKSIQSPETGNATGSNFPNSIAVGGASTFPATAVDPTLGGASLALLLDSADGTKSLSIRLNALEQEGRVRIVSRPAVATTNNTPAIIRSVEKIRVKTPSGGTVVGVGQGSTPSSGGSTATESIEIGIILEVVPQASPDYFVLLDLNAKSSTFGSQVVDGIPSEIERSATSSVLVSSGQTFAMGGIYRIIDSDTVTGVPFLKDLPVFGHLFRTIQTDNRDEELIFFVTPRIIEGSFDDAAMKVAL